MFIRKIKRVAAALLAAVMTVTVGLCSLTSCSEEEINEWLEVLLGEESSATTVGDTLKGDAVLKMHVIDIGQGDAILMQCSTQNVLIDCGENGMGETVLAYLDKEGVTKLDWLIGTHPHSDHIGGMDTVIKSDIKISKVMMPQLPDDLTPTTRTYTEVLDAISARKLKITRPAQGKEYDLDGVTMQVLSPKKKAAYTDLNDYSIVLKFTYGNVSILTGGDATKVVEKELLKKGGDLHADIFKLSHHGSRESNSAAFLKAVNPRFCAISVGADNSYGHPHEQTMARLETLGCEVHRTDLNGDLLYQTDGTYISVTLSK